MSDPSEPGNHEYVEFILSDEGIVDWKDVAYLNGQNECRNIGLRKIVENAFPYIKDMYGEIKNPIKIIIHTGDRPDYDVKKDKNTIEFQTISTTYKDDLFPDYIFGDWWHIGLTDFDKFTDDISTNCIKTIPIYNRVFWAGNLQNIPQRLQYKHISKLYPTAIECLTIKWKSPSEPTKFVKIRDLGQWSMIIDLTGYGWSGRLKMLPFCKRPLIITNRKYWGWSDFMILKTKNFYMANKDLSNLIQIVNYIKNNKAKAQLKADNLYNYVSEKFKFDNVCKYAADIIVKKMREIEKIV